MLKKISIIFILFILTALSTSCFDDHEVDDLAFVTTIGIDKGVADIWRFSFQITNMKSGGKSKESGGKEAPKHV
ncbi:MAG: hypothetical protein WCY24_07465, partial [Lutispora sp.]